MKKLLVILGIIIAVLLAGILILMFVIGGRAAPERGEPPALPMPVTGAAVNIFDGVLELKNYTLVNPAGFAERTFISFPEIFVSVDTGTLRGARPKHVREVRVAIAEIVAIRRSDGEYNFEWLLRQEKAQEKAAEEAKEKKTRLRIDRLRFTFGRVTFLDYTVGGDKPLFIRFDINLDKTYTGISDLEALGKAVTGDVLDKIDIGEIRNFDIGDLPDISRSALDAIPDETKDRIFGRGKERDKVLKELGGRFLNKIKDIGKNQ